MFPEAHRYSRRQPRSSRGQGLVEMAIVLPLLALLMVMAVDFGRVFFGWVALQNAARVAADYAAKNYDSWSSPDDPDKQVERDRYEELILKDAVAINCALATVPDPEFTDEASGAPVILPATGDRATVELDCLMPLMTPLAESVLGGGVAMSADATFAAHTPETINLPEAEAPPPPPGCEAGEARVPGLVGKTMQAAWDAWNADFVADASHFSPALVASGPGNNKNKIVLTQDPAADVCLSTTSGTMTVTHP